MKKIAAACILLSMASACFAQHIDPSKMDKTIPTPLKVNLDLPVHERYAELHQIYA